MNKPEAVITDIYDAWRMQDVEWLATYLPDDFCHVNNVPLEIDPLAGGVRYGKRATLERLQFFFSRFECHRFEATPVVLQHDQATVEVEFHTIHKESGVPCEERRTDFWTFEDGWPVKLCETYDVERIRAFISSVPWR